MSKTIQQWNAQCRCKGCTGHGLGWIKHVQPKNYQPRPHHCNNQNVSRTHNIDGFSVNPATGEIMGIYTIQDYHPEPYGYTIQAKKNVANRSCFVMSDDGTPIDVGATSDITKQCSGDVIEFPAQADYPKSNAGSPVINLTNPICGYLQFFRFDGHSTSWIDDCVIGACGTQVEREGGGTPTTGRFNVSPGDVRRVLYLPEISTETAATVLCNHNVEPMSIRQVERVVQAARIALGGLMLHLERRPELLEQFNYTLDFDAFWKERGGQLRGASLEKLDAILLFQQDQSLTIKHMAERFGVHRNTASKWRQEALMHN